MGLRLRLDDAGVDWLAIVQVVSIAIVIYGAWRYWLVDR